MEETFTIPLKCIDFARSIHIDLDVLQEKKIGDYWNVDRASICQILGEDLQSSLFWKRSFQKETFGLGETDKNSDDYQTRFLYGQKNGRKLVKPFTIEKNKIGQKKSKNLTMLENWEDFILLTQMTENIQKFSKTQENKKDPWHQPCHAKDGSSQNHESDAEQWQSKGFQNNVWLYSGILINPQGNEWNVLYSQNMKIALQEMDFFFDTLPFVCSKFIPDGTSDEDSGCKSCSGKEMEEDPNDSSLAVGQSQVQKVGYSGSTKRQNKSSLLHW